MKTLKILCSFSLLFLMGYLAAAQSSNEERLNLPGDNLNLYAVMTLFQESETLESFEKNLNAQDSRINNLDLNNDDRTDYIRVIDNVDGNVHTIVLQVSVNKHENQDIAVFTVQRDADNNVVIHLVGDEELYGKGYIIEPYYDDVAASETPNPGYVGKTKIYKGEKVTVVRTTYYEVAAWPLVRFIYTPTYVVWHSPWYWGYYPPYWNPWSPFYWDYYYGYHSNYYNHYYSHYRHSQHYRYAHYNDHYYNDHRSYSNTVYQHRQSGSYNNTYSRPDMRKQGSADFKRRNSDNRRTDDRQGKISDEHRNKSKSQINKPSRRTEVNNPTVKPSARPDARSPRSKPEIKRNETRPSSGNTTERTNVNKHTSRPSHEVKSGNPRSTSKSETKKATSKGDRSKSSDEKKRR